MSSFYKHCTILLYVNSEKYILWSWGLQLFLVVFCCLVSHVTRTKYCSTAHSVQADRQFNLVTLRMCQQCHQLICTGFPVVTK